MQPRLTPYIFSRLLLLPLRFPSSIHPRGRPAEYSISNLCFAVVLPSARVRPSAVTVPPSANLYIFPLAWSGSLEVCGGGGGRGSKGGDGGGGGGAAASMKILF